MKIIDCYYRFDKLNPEKSKSRFDLVYHSEIYEPLNNPNPKGQVFIYAGKNPHIRSHKNREASLTISARDKHLSSVFIPEITKPNLAFGDFGSDAILILLSEKTIELLICKGKKNLTQNLFNLLFDGELDSEIENFRNEYSSIIEQVHEYKKNDLPYLKQKLDYQNN